MKNYILRYGVIGGTINIALGITNWFTVARLGPTISQAIGWITIILSLMCIPLGIRYFRDKLNNGAVAFGEALKIGLGITFIYTVLSAIYSVVFFILAGDSFKNWQKRGLSEAELQAFERQLEQTPEIMQSPWFQALILFIMIFIIGLIVTLISSLILKRNSGATQ